MKLELESLNLDDLDVEELKEHNRVWKMRGGILNPVFFEPLDGPVRGCSEARRTGQPRG